jgi:hypothetical protein
VVEKINYKILEKINNIEIREYPDLILAYVENVNDDGAFGLLFNYISGNNMINKKISMTAPVINSKKIEMTTPVLSNDEYMAFVMPNYYNEKTIPKPINSNVKIRVQKKRKLAVIRFGGYSTYNKIKKYKEILLNKLNQKKIKTKGNIILMRYNSPFSLPFMRKNEIGIEVH